MAISLHLVTEKGASYDEESNVTVAVSGKRAKYGVLVVNSVYTTRAERSYNSARRDKTIAGSSC